MNQEGLDFSLTGLSPSLALFPAASTKSRFCNFPRVPGNPPFTSYYPDLTALLGCNVKTGLGCSPFRSPLLRESLLLSLPQGTKMFQFPWFASATYVFSDRYYGFTHSRFSDSVIPGSKDACSSPRLIAACHDLHRLPVPRHPPYALICLTILFILLFMFKSVATVTTLDRILYAGHNSHLFH